MSSQIKLWPLSQIWLSLVETEFNILAVKETQIVFTANLGTECIWLSGRHVFAMLYTYFAVLIAFIADVNVVNLFIRC